MHEPPFHPLASMFPPMSSTEFSALVDDIRENGQKEPVLLFEGLVVDGRHRWSACAALGIEPQSTEWSGDEESLIRHIVSTNLHRRHLSPTDRAMLAASYANLPRGTNRHSVLDPSRDGSSLRQQDAASLFGVSDASITRAKRVAAKGSQELVAALRGGDISLAEAARVASLPKAAQIEILQAAAEIRIRKVNEKRDRLRGTVEASRDAVPDSLPQGRFQVVVADFPFDYRSSKNATSNADPRHHYPTMSLADIAALPIRDILADDALLLLWSPSMFLADVIAMLPAFGCRYHSTATWSKGRGVVGAGLLRQSSEFLVLAVRGGGLGKPMRQLPSVFDEKTKGHSTKPETPLAWIEEAFPHVEKRCELFARRPRAGWVVWGASPSL